MEMTPIPLWEHLIKLEQQSQVNTLGLIAFIFIIYFFTFVYLKIDFGLQTPAWPLLRVLIKELGPCPMHVFQVHPHRSLSLCISDTTLPTEGGLNQHDLEPDNSPKQSLSFC